MTKKYNVYRWMSYSQSITHEFKEKNVSRDDDIYTLSTRSWEERFGRKDSVPANSTHNDISSYAIII